MLFCVVDSVVQRDQGAMPGVVRAVLVSPEALPGAQRLGGAGGPAPLTASELLQVWYDIAWCDMVWYGI